VQFGKVAMIGRLLLDVFPVKICELLARDGLPCEPFRNRGASLGYAEDFFRCLGATQVDSLDASAYEGASVIQDMNQPIPAALKEQYDVVYDGGTIEHVFNIPVALRNCMEMVKPGGHLFFDSPGNNWFGHGFYQLSPEFFYRTLAPENGYRVVEMIAHAAGPQARWYRVADPNEIRCRIQLISFSLVHLLTHAQRERSCEMFTRSPQQSDYTTAWQAGGTGAPILAQESNRVIRAVSKVWPGLAHLLKAMRTAVRFYRTFSLRNRKFFTPIEGP
jgi:SAM-dependent methyltransferase